MTAPASASILRLLASVALAAPAARADGPVLATAVSPDAVYLYWGPVPDARSGVDVYRSAGGAPFERVARVGRIADPDEIGKVLRGSPDALSRAFRPGPDLHAKADASPGDDEGLSLSASGYARIRGYAFLDATVAKGTAYRYRILPAGADAAGPPIAEASAVAGKPLPRPSPLLSVKLAGNVPALTWAGEAFTGYELHRADRAEGPYVRLTLAPVPPAPQAQPVLLSDDRAPSDGRTVYYRIAATDLLGQPGPPSAPASVVTADRRAPSQPMGVTTRSSPGVIRVTWKRNADPVSKGYRVYRYLVEKGVGALRDGLPEKRELLTKEPLPLKLTAYDDRAATPERMYVYTVAAIDGRGKEGPMSPPALGSVKSFTPPARPARPAARVEPGGKIVLTWKASPAANLSRYRLHKGVGRDGKLAYARQVEAGAAAEVTVEERLDRRSREVYRYAVSAVDRSDNESALSEPVEVRLPDEIAPIPPVVTSLSAASGAVTVGWAPSPDADVAGYHVYRKQRGSAAPAARVTAAALPASRRSHTDATAEAGVVYEYAVTALDGAGNESAPSELRSVATFRERAPLPPTGVATSVEPKSRRRLLGWQAREGARGYLVLGGPQRDGAFRQLGGVVKEPPLAIPDAVAAGDWLRVRAVYPGGAVSAPSEAVPAPGRQGR